MNLGIGLVQVCGYPVPTLLRRGDRHTAPTITTITTSTIGPPSFDVEYSQRVFFFPQNNPL